MLFRGALPRQEQRAVAARFSARRYAPPASRYCGARYRIYDAVAWSAITPLSEQSIAGGFKTLEFPDFTDGKWTDRKPIFALDDRY
jgi:hypothetical protein